MNTYLTYRMRSILLLISCSGYLLMAQANPHKAPQSGMSTNTKLNFESDPLQFYINFFKVFQGNKNEIEAFKSTCSLFDLKVNPDPSKGIHGVNAETKDGWIAIWRYVIKDHIHHELRMVKRYPHGGIDKDVDFFSSLVLRHVKDGDFSQPKMEYNKEGFTMRFLIGDTESYMDKDLSSITIVATVAIIPYWTVLSSPIRSCHPFSGGGSPAGPCVILDDFLRLRVHGA